MTLRPVIRSSCRVHGAVKSAPRVHQQQRTIFGAKKSNRATTQDFDLNKLNQKRRDYEYNRTAFLAAGAVAGTLSFIYTAWKLKKALDERAADKAKAEKKKEREASAGHGRVVQLDSPVPTETFKTEAGERRKVVVRDADGDEIVPTGNSVVPAFPRTIDIRLPSSTNQQEPGDVAPIQASIAEKEGTEFTLVGLGTRSVTFLGINVYVVGFYVATQDVAKLQNYLVKTINPLATTLIPSEKDSLRKALLDPAEGERLWAELLERAGCRSAFRIIPVKDTDFPHLRDGLVRAIQARTQRDREAYGDEAFGAALRDFKRFFQRSQLPKKHELLMCRDGEGKLSLLYSTAQTKDTAKDVIGVVEDERISKLLWLNYLAGSKVASEEARGSVITGVMEFVERPVGTVATQVL
jgi:hypothetical protein